MQGNSPRAVASKPSVARRRFTALALAAALLVAALFGQELALDGVRWLIAKRFSDVPRIDAETLALALDAAGPPRVLLDARSREEFAVSHLRDATRVDPDAPDLASPGVDRTRPVVVYCSVGYRSARVVRALRAAGWRDVRNLDGGIFAWVNAGFPVVRGDRWVHEVHPYDALWGVMLRGARRVRVAPR